MAERGKCKPMRAQVILPLLSLILLLPLSSEAQFTLSGQVRPRAEYRHGYKKLADEGQNPAFFIQQRTRLLSTYRTDQLRFGLTVQDIRTWGSVKQLNVSDDHLSIHEAWGELVLNEHFSLKLGRQELAYDDRTIWPSSSTRTAPTRSTPGPLSIRGVPAWPTRATRCRGITKRCSSYG
jgi:hypothetical protein